MLLLLHREPEDIQDTMVMDAKDSSTTGEDVSSKKEQSGYLSMLEIIDELKRSTER